jgi:hypothetical protein
MVAFNQHDLSPRRHESQEAEWANRSRLPVSSDSAVASQPTRRTPPFSPRLVVDLALLALLLLATTGFVLGLMLLAAACVLS